jgi:hypothetical protein
MELLPVSLLELLLLILLVILVMLELGPLLQLLVTVPQTPLVVTNSFLLVNVPSLVLLEMRHELLLVRVMPVPLDLTELVLHQMPAIV